MFKMKIYLFSALEIKPDYETAWYNKGISYSYLKNHQEAIKCYSKVTEVKINRHQAWYKSGSMFIETLLKNLLSILIFQLSNSFIHKLGAI